MKLKHGDAQTLTLATLKGTPFMIFDSNLDPVRETCKTQKRKSYV